MKTFKLQLNTYLSNLATLLGEENCPVPLNVFRTVFINISDIMALYYESMNMAKIKVKSAARTSAIR